MRKLVIALAVLILPQMAEAKGGSKRWLVDLAGFVPISNTYDDRLGIGTQDNFIPLINNLGGELGAYFTLGPLPVMIGPHYNVLWHFKLSYSGGSALLSWDIGLGALIFPMGEAGRGLFIQAGAGRAEVILTETAHQIGLGVTGFLGYAINLGRVAALNLSFGYYGRLAAFGYHHVCFKLGWSFGT